MFFLQICFDSRVEFITPDYDANSTTDIQSSGEIEEVFTTDCSKLVPNEPYHGNNYSVTFKHKATPNVQRDIVTKMELSKLSDNTLVFTYYYSIRKNNQIIMVVGMNIKALNLVSNK